MSSIHDRIKAKRKMLGLSLQKLAKEVGVEWQAVQKWENGASAPKRTRLAKVAAVLNTTPEYLATGLDILQAASSYTVAEAGTTYGNPPPDLLRLIALLESMPRDEQKRTIDSIETLLFTGRPEKGEGFATKYLKPKPNKSLAPTTVTIDLVHGTHNPEKKHGRATSMARKHVTGKKKESKQPTSGIKEPK